LANASLNNQSQSPKTTDKASQLPIPANAISDNPVLTEPQPTPPGFIHQMKSLFGSKKPSSTDDTKEKTLYTEKDIEYKKKKYTSIEGDRNERVGGRSEGTRNIAKYC